MAPIHQYLDDQAAFEPEAMAAMARAFEAACNSLHVFKGDEQGREIIAARIIDLARSGLIDARALRDRVLQEAHTDA